MKNFSDKLKRLWPLAVIALLFSCGPAHAAQTFAAQPTTGTLSGVTLVTNENTNEAALLSSFSGTSAPTLPSPVAGQLWYNTSTSTLEVYSGSAFAAVSSGGGSMVYPGAGIANSTGSAWGTSYGVSGSGSVCLTTNCVLTTPTLGAATATSLTTSGDIGIGTATPQTILHVHGGAIVSDPSTLTISTATFTPVAIGANTVRVVLTSACPCTIAAPSGTPVDGTRMLMEIWQDGTGSRTIGTWNAIYDFGTSGAPTLTTTASKGDGLGFTYSAQNSKWNYIGVQQGW